MTEARLDLQSGDGAMFGPPPDTKNPLLTTEFQVNTANDQKINTPVLGSDSSRGEPVPSASSLATENVPVAQIETDRSDLVSPVEQVSSVGGTNLTPLLDSKNPLPLKDVPVSMANDST